jgi:hypothetical protein
MVIEISMYSYLIAAVSIDRLPLQSIHTLRALPLPGEDSVGLNDWNGAKRCLTDFDILLYA